MIKVKMEDIVMKFSLKASGFGSNNYSSKVQMNQIFYMVFRYALGVETELTVREIWHYVSFLNAQRANLWGT